MSTGQGVLTLSQIDDYVTGGGDVAGVEPPAKKVGKLFGITAFVHGVDAPMLTFASPSPPR